MEKLFQNKKLVILSGIVLVVLVGVIVWACIGCSGNKKVFSEDGMEVVDLQDEDETEEEKDKSESQTKEDEIKAPSNWGNSDTPSLDEGDNGEQKPTDKIEETEETDDTEPEKTGGYGKPF